MIKVLSVLLLVLLAGPFSGRTAHAGDVEQRFLYGRVLQDRELGWACYSRRYDPVHLRSHPDQNVSEIAMLAYRPDWPGAAASILNFKARFRDGGLAEFSGECKEGRGVVLACGMECDGGQFALRKAGGGAIMVDMPLAPMLCNDGEGAAFAADDTLFRLDRADLADCRDLIWDDEIRPRLLQAAGQ